MNPDYVAEAPAPTPTPAPVAAPAPIATPAPEPAPAPVSLGGVGTTSYYGDGQTPDAGKPWAAPATVYAQPAAAPAAPAVAAAVNGCSVSLAAAVKDGMINFATSRWDILPDSYATLDNIAKLAKACDGVAIEVSGHTDNTGKAASNKTLSELRAKAVVNYLTGAGVDAAKLKAAGYGQDKPIDDNGTVEGRRANRRIEFGVTAN
ncbi:MAG: OmpA family protein [Hyphomicrobium sp.]|nr:OmpA family protein [Hyphomicrobium sp.]